MCSQTQAQPSMASFHDRGAACLLLGVQNLPLLSQERGSTLTTFVLNKSICLSFIYVAELDKNDNSCAVGTTEAWGSVGVVSCMLEWLVIELILIPKG